MFFIVAKADVNNITIETRGASIAHNVAWMRKREKCTTFFASEMQFYFLGICCMDHKHFSFQLNVISQMVLTQHNYVQKELLLAEFLGFGAGL